MRRPGDPNPDSESSGGHAAERLREFLDKRTPQPSTVPDPSNPADDTKPVRPDGPPVKKPRT
jgi:hypothetical protein